MLVKLPGSDKFVELDATAKIPLGATIDTKKGRIRLTAEPGEAMGGSPYRSAPGARGDALRRPVNLALVIDRSSSMRGPRLSQAVLAVRRLIERLDERFA